MASKRFELAGGVEVLCVWISSAKQQSERMQEWLDMLWTCRSIGDRDKNIQFKIEQQRVEKWLKKPRRRNYSVKEIIFCLA